MLAARNGIRRYRAKRTVANDNFAQDFALAA